MSLLNKRVAIVGAGVSGLATAKHQLEQGLIPTVFEKYNSIGGIWNQECGNTWNTMHTNLSKFYVSLSDFPWPKSTQILPTTQEVAEYLQNYAKHFNLIEHIKCNSKVTYVTQLENKKWLVKWENTSTNETYEDTFDCLILSSGIYSKGFIAQYDNMNQFKGNLIHSKGYNALKTSQSLHEKRVIVIGQSFSGAEISADLVRAGASVLNIINRPYWILPALIKMNPQSSSPGLPADCLMFNRKAANTNSSAREINTLMATIIPLQNKIPPLYIDPTSDDPLIVATSTDYIKFAHEGKIVVKRQKIKKFTENGVILDDDTFEHADVVIFCTGYRLSLDFVDKKLLDIMEFDEKQYLQPLILYKSTFHLDLENFACVGLIKESIYPILEAQSRWVSMVFSGKVKLPPREEFEAALKSEREYRNLPEYKYKMQIRRERFVLYADDIAKEIGALPDFEKIKESEPELYRMLWEGPLSSIHYRLNENKEFTMQHIHEIDEYIKNAN